jgi:hypothetical protein
MDNQQLLLLISLYEEEGIQLQKSIESYLEEKEYLLADYHLKVLNQVDGKLRTLHSLHDKLYDEKTKCKRIINGLHKLAETQSSPVVKNLLENQVIIETEKLEKLNQIASYLNYAGNDKMIEDALRQLMDKKIKNLRLILIKSDNFILKFSYSKNSLQVVLPNVKQHSKNHLLNENNITDFKNIGFDLIQNETKLVANISGDTTAIMNRVSIIMSKIVFDIFYFKVFENESYIQFTILSKKYN